MIKLRYSPRLIVLMTLAIVSAVALHSVLVYWNSTRSLERRLCSELLAVVEATAPMIDGDLHQIIYRRDDGSIAGLEEFELIRRRLLDVKKLHRLGGKGSPIYTMRPTFDYESTGGLEFVVMSDRDDERKFFVGNRYTAQTHNRMALKGTGEASGIYRDSEGTWISASAPIRDSEGQVVGIIQADRSVDFLYDEALAAALELAWAGVIAAVFGAILAAGLSIRLTRPVRELVAAARAVAANDFSQRVTTTSSNEMGELAATFNDMMERLSSRSQSLDTARRSAEADTAAKSDRMSTLANWIQTPIQRAIHLLNELLESDASPEQAKLLEMVRDEALSAQRLADQLRPDPSEMDRSRPDQKDWESAADSQDSASPDAPAPSSVAKTASVPWSIAGLEPGLRPDAAPRAGGAASASGRSSRVLLAEDNPDLRREAVAAIRDLGWDVDAVEDGSTAIRRASQHAYDLILMDCQMPKVDGLQATRRIRRAEATGSRVRVIGLVSDGGSGRRQKCIDAEMDDTAVKPLTPAALRRILASAASSPATPER